MSADSEVFETEGDFLIANIAIDVGAEFAWDSIGDRIIAEILENLLMNASR